MNLLLFRSESELRHITPADPRLAHVRQVLRPACGDKLYVGLLNGKRAWATLLRDDPQEGIFTEPHWEEQEPPQPLPLRVLVGLPRPQTARKVLFEAAACGVARLDFFQSDKGEPSYAKSSLWHSNEWQERLWQGAEQACVTTLPEVNVYASLQAALDAPQHTANTAEHLPAAETGAQAMPTTTATAADQIAALPEVRLALDIYEAIAPLSTLVPLPQQTPRRLTLAIGSERGWSAAERSVLTEHSFVLTHIGPRVLRTETAFVAAVAIAADRLLHAE